MTLGHGRIEMRLGAGMGLSVLMHALLLTLAFIWLGPQAIKAPPPHYRISLVDLPDAEPAMEHTPPDTAIPTPAQRPAEAPLPWRPPVSISPAPPSLSAESPETGTHEPPDSTRSPRTTLGPLAFYDPMEIMDTVQRSQEEGPTADGVTFDTRDMMYAPYMNMLRQKVESIWEYPRVARQQKLYGDLIIRFVILKDGTLGDVRVLRTSGHRLLDEAAVKALRDGVPYWPLPDGWNRQSLAITGRFVYIQSNAYIR